MLSKAMDRPCGLGIVELNTLLILLCQDHHLFVKYRLLLELNHSLLEEPDQGLVG